MLGITLFLGGFLPLCASVASPVPATVGVAISQCGSWFAIQRLMAAQWAAPENIKVLDMCEEKVFEAGVYETVRKALDPEAESTFLGTLGVGEEALDDLGAVEALGVAVVAASPLYTPNMIPTAPSLSDLVKPTLALAEELGLTHTTLISSCTDTIQQMAEAASEKGIVISRTLKVVKNSKLIGEVVKKFIQQGKRDVSLIMILEREELSELAGYLRSELIPRRILITATLGLNKNLIKLWKPLLADSFLVEPHVPQIPQFRQYLIDKIQDAENSGIGYLKTYVEQAYKCRWGQRLVNENITLCSSLTSNEIGAKLMIDPEVIFVVKGMAFYSSALRLINESKSKCSKPLRVCVSNIMRGMSQGLSGFQVLGKDDLMLTNRYVVLRIGRVGDLIAVGWFTEEKGLVLDWSQKKNQNKKSQSMSRGLNTGVTTIEDPIHFDVNIQRVSHEHHVLKVWWDLAVALASIGVVVTTFMIIYVCFKIYDGTLSGNQSLGIVLLFAISVLYLSIILSILNPSGLRCIFRQLVYPLSMTVCFGILLVKVMQLRSLVMLGLGGRISYLNQYMILFFIILVQAVLCVQMLFSDRTWTRKQNDGSVVCVLAQVDFLTLHVYSLILSLIAFIYGLSVLKIRRNYKEGQWVTVACGLSIPIFVIWGVIKYFASNKVQEPVTCFCLFFLASILVATVFFPKMHTISKQNLRSKQKNFSYKDPLFTTFGELKHSYPLAEYITKNPLYQAANSAYP